MKLNKAYSKTPHTMLYKFKSKATGDVIMLEPNGRRVLEIIGKTPGPQGIILSSEMAAAIAALDAAAPAGASKAGETDDEVQLRQRSVPFIDLLKASLSAGEDVVWGA